MTFNRKKSNSLIVSLFLCETFVCKIITCIIPIPKISVLLMVLLSIVSLVINNRISLICLKRTVLLWLFIQLLLIISGLINGFSNVSNYWQYFMVFGTSAAVISMNDFDVNYLIKYTSIIYAVFFVVYFIAIRKSFLDSGDTYYGDSMGISYAMTIIVYVLILYCFYKRSIILSKKVVFLLFADALVALFIILFDCRSRGSVLALVCALLIVFIARSTTQKRIVRIIAGATISIVIVFNYNNILTGVYYFLNAHNIEVRFLNKMIYLSRSNIGLLNGREMLYDEAYKHISSNLMMGHGIGYLESYGFGYVHNIFLEILLSFGIIGMVIIIALFILFMRRVFLMHDDLAVVKFFLLFFSGEMMLNFSSSYWLYPSFWLMIFGFINLSKRTDYCVIHSTT